MAFSGWRLTLVLVSGFLAGTGCSADDEGPGSGTSFPAQQAANAAGTGALPMTGDTGGDTTTGQPPIDTGGAAGMMADLGVEGMDGMAGTVADEGMNVVNTEVPSESSCLDGITDFFSDGPFDFTQERSGSVHLYVPMVPAGCMVPVTHLANGTGGSCGVYASIHQRFASHGFLATCYESGQTGNGSQGLEAYQTALSMYPDVAAKRFGSTGHSQGGQAAFTVLQLAEAEWGDEGVYAGLAMEPASGFGAQPSGGSWQQVYAMIRSPMFMFSGTRDTLVSQSWVSRGFAALDPSIEAYHWSAIGATHIPTPNSETEEVGVPFFRWKLLGDAAACQAFKDLEGAGNWTSVEEQNAAPCN